MDELKENESPANEATVKRIAVFCVGNKLMLDDGIGPAVYEDLLARYELPDNVDVFDVGCLTMDLVAAVEDYDVIITVDAVDGEEDEPGTVYRFEPDAIAPRVGATASLHDLKLVDLFNAATLLGNSCEGLCLGMHVENASPSELVIGLTPHVAERLPFLTDVLVGELSRLGAAPLPKDGGLPSQGQGAQKG